MTQFILYFTGTEHAPEDDVQRIQRDPHTAIVRAADDMLLVDSNRRSIDQFLTEMPDWSVTRGSSIEFPVESSLTRAARASHG
jgi:hypothetical protein